MIKRNVFIFIGLVCFSVLLFHCSPDESVVAQVGDQKIFKSEYITLLQRHFPKQENYQNVNSDRKKAILEELIKKNLKISVAYELGLDKDDEFIANTRRYSESLINRRYYEITVMDHIVSQSDIERFLNNQKFTVNASHILISYRGVNPTVERSRKEALDLATEIVNELKKEGDFLISARKYSDDPSAQSNGGNLGEFTWGQMVDPFQEALWQMEIGEIRGPVETRYGFHIIRLNDRKDRPDYNLRKDEETLSEIKQKIFSMRADSGRAYWLKYVNDLKDKKDFRIHTLALSTLAEMISEKLNEGDLSPGDFENDLLQTNLASWEGGFFNINDLIEPQKDRFTRYVVSIKQIHLLRKEVDSEATKKLILDDAIDKGLKKDDFVRTNVRKMVGERLAQMAETHEIHDNIRITDEEAYTYYNDNGSTFEKPAEIELWEIFLPDLKTAEKVLRLARSGSDFESLARKYSKDNVFAAKGGYVGFRSQGARGPISQKAIEKGSGEIGGPVKYRNGWTIYKTGEYRKSQIRQFEEVKSQVIGLIRRERIVEQRKKWEQNLRSRFTIIINENELDRI